MQPAWVLAAPQVPDALPERALPLEPALPQEPAELQSPALTQFVPESQPWFQAALPGLQPWFRDGLLLRVLYALEPSAAWPRQPLRACHGWR